MGGTTSLLCDQSEEVVYFTDRETGLRGMTVLDDVRLGRSVGACRSRPYDEEERALADALRQAKTTTAKALLADLPFSGGCSVILNETPGDTRFASPMPALGRTVQSLGGRYYLLPDLQGQFVDTDQVAPNSDFILGQDGTTMFNAIEATAVGNLVGIEMAVRNKLGVSGLMGIGIGIIGLGDVGFRLAELLRQEGARLTVADRDPRRTERAVRELGINCVTIEEIIHLDNAVLATCAAKDSIDDWTVSHLRCQILAGAVDDPLTSASHGQALHDRGILFAPDTIINAGGLISLVQPLLSPERASTPIHQELQAIGQRLDNVIDRSVKANLPTSMITEHMIEEALAARLEAQLGQSLAS